VNPARRALLLGIGRTGGLFACRSSGGSTGLFTGLFTGLADSAQATELPNTQSVRRGQTLHFPRDHGAHLDVRTEWWYATGWLGTPAAPTHGFQVTFFRSRTGVAQAVDSRFAARHLLFAHAALTTLTGTSQAASHGHDQRMVRWSGAPRAALGAAGLDGGDVRIGGWFLRDQGSAWLTQVQAAGFGFELQLKRSQPLLLQGDGGFSRKGPEESQASHYISEPQLQVQGRVWTGTEVGGHAGGQAGGHAATPASAQSAIASGQAWMDHEWSDQMLHPQAVGWDWIGMNLFDGSALTAFVLRRADGSTLWAGGSFRAAATTPASGITSTSTSTSTTASMPAAAAQSFAPDAVRFTPGRRWRSAASGANYPVQCTVNTPAGSFEVRALLDAQELNGSQSTGSVYWEGLSELLDAQGRRVGLGYLEMTGYAAPIKFL
jgi:predicted secreted hydrolase